MTPPALRRLMTLVEARRARDLATLDRRLDAEVAELRRTPARDAEDGAELPPERQALRVAWAEQRIRAARRRQAALAEAIRTARATAAVSLGKHKSLEILVERADRSVEQARSARAEREAPPARSEPLT